MKITGKYPAIGVGSHGDLTAMMGIALPLDALRQATLGASELLAILDQVAARGGCPIEAIKLRLEGVETGDVLLGTILIWHVKDVTYMMHTMEDWVADQMDAWGEAWPLDTPVPESGDTVAQA